LDTLEALKHAAGFLRRELGHRMKIRTVPQLHFHYDESIEEGGRLSSLIDAAIESDRRKSGGHNE
jgi:ribosome-binding factor A